MIFYFILFLQSIRMLFEFHFSRYYFAKMKISVILEFVLLELVSLLTLYVSAQYAPGVPPQQYVSVLEKKLFRHRKIQF